MLSTFLPTPCGFELAAVRLFPVCSPSSRKSLLLQVLPWILDVGYTVLAVSLMVAFMGQLLFGDFEVTMITLPDSITGQPIHA